MRLIDADKLKEYVNSKSTHPLCEWDTTGVLMAIDEQETVEQKWIPCSERLPKDGVNVILSCEYMFLNYITVGYFKNGNRGHSYIVDNDTFFRSAIIAWMPLPEPYKE